MRVLIAEDDPISRRMLQALVASWGYDAELAGDGTGAWEALQRPDAPRLALLDWLMPGLDGVEVCRRARQAGGPEPPYLILVSARDEKRHVIEGLRAGANDYVSKPFDSEELRARLEVGARVVELQSTLAYQLEELKDAVAHVKRLQGILPICMYCHKIRTDRESWDRIEKYIMDHTEARFSHGICPDCMKERYPDYLEEEESEVGEE